MAPAQLPFDPIGEAKRQWTAHGWDGSAAEGMAIVTSIMRVHQLLLARVDSALRPFHISYARYEVLMLLWFSRRGTLPLGKIGRRLQVQAGAVTNAVNRLEADGLVERRPHPSDGRTTLAVITRRGRSVARAATTELNRAVFSEIGLPGDDSQELYGLLRQLRLLAGDFEGPSA